MFVGLFITFISPSTSQKLNEVWFKKINCKLCKSKCLLHFTFGNYKIYIALKQQIELKQHSSQTQLIAKMLTIFIYQIKR